MVTRVSNGMVETGSSPEVGDYCLSARSSKPKWLLCDGGAYSRSVYAALYAQVGTAFGPGDGSTTFNVPDPKGRSLVVSGSGSTAESVLAAAVSPGTDLITVVSNADKWVTGMKVQATTTGTLPTGLALATDYFVIRISATTIKLASSLALAVAGTAIDITGTGTGTHTLTHTLTARAAGDKGGEEGHVSTISEMPAHDHVVYGATSSGAGGSAVTVPSSGSPYAADNKTAPAGGGAAHNNMSPFLAIGNLFIYAGV